ncbi:glycerol kinase GlpK [Maritalea mediterranea]|uniref:Glycerol kinase n=1 Tax=Maritalea mediterranea TaxID=2909667 RepID=A0ABS9EB24_9HYPH|nr:glycerol kinase GlpK [Maritalea mediterranea]MCF4099384.1 glycerol kinase GlpK [Maritalea mediterranea]
MSEQNTNYLLAIDQGTTSSRAILYNLDLNPFASDQQEFKQIFPQDGWVEHDANEIWYSVEATVKGAIKKADITTADIAAIGITNQRETITLWDRATGEPLHHAIVWQDRRTARYCAELKQKGLEEKVTAKTGLLLDPYFSGTKIKWLLDNVAGARDRAAKGELAIGTIDSWLIYRLTGGASHVTDATNASRTLLYNIHEGKWDHELLDLFDIPPALLPEVKDCAADFGTTDPDLFGTALPITGVAGDQHAASIGQACFEKGMIKSTYGTGCFAMMNVGDTPLASSNRLLSTLCYQLDGKPTYALEGSIYMAGATVQWLRDGLKIIESAPQVNEFAEQADETQSVYLVPGFVGLGAPYWDSDARGAIFGLTRNSGPNELAKAALESVGYQTRDLITAMNADFGDDVGVLRVDGGMTASDMTMQFLADICQIPVDRPQNLETTAKGAAYLAGLHVGLCPPPQDMMAKWELDQQFTPQQSADWAEKKYAGWQDAVSRTLSTHSR